MTDDGVDRDRWNAVHSRMGTPVLSEIRRATLTAALPPEVDATTVWPAWPLDRVAELLGLASGETLADIACGNSELGRWVARHAGALYIGVDPSIEALKQARARAASSRATFVEGHFTATGLPDASVDGVLIVDAFFLATDEGASLRELARILRPGRRLVVVGAEPRGRTWACDELTVVERIETQGWRDVQRAFVDLLNERRDDLVAAMGAAATDDLLARPWSDFQSDFWHGIVVAERTR